MMAPSMHTKTPFPIFHSQSWFHLEKSPLINNEWLLKHTKTCFPIFHSPTILWKTCTWQLENIKMMSWNIETKYRLWVSSRRKYYSFMKKNIKTILFFLFQNLHFPWGMVLLISIFLWCSNTVCQILMLCHCLDLFCPLFCLVIYAKHVIFQDK